MGYFKSDGKYIYLDAPHAEFYIPKFYFDKSGAFAEDLGITIKVLGVFNIGIFENGNRKDLRVFNVPTWIDLYVSNYEDRNVELPGFNEPVPCKVILYDNGNKITDATTIEDSSNVESFLDFILKGKVPAMIPYDKTIQIWRKNKELNSVHLGVPSVIEELILAVAYRYNKDPSRKFGQVAGNNDDISMFDYVMNNIRAICQYTSTFTGLTFEDIDSMITTSLNRTKNKGYESSSPLEDLIKL